MNNQKIMERGEKLMKARDFSGAINAFSEILEKKPDNVKAMLKLGICHLLNRSEESFLKIYRKAEKIITKMKKIPDDVTNLWGQYKRLIARVTAASLVIGTTAIPTGCSESAHKYSGGVYKPTSTEKVTDQNTTETNNSSQEAPANVEETAPKPRPHSAHLYSGGVYMEKIELVNPKDALIDLDKDETPKEDEGTDKNTTGTNNSSQDVPAKVEEAAPQTKPGSAHKYSGGVYMEPSAIKYKKDALIEIDEKIKTPPTSSHRYSGGVYKKRKTE